MGRVSVHCESYVEVLGHTYQSLLRVITLLKSDTKNVEETSSATYWQILAIYSIGMVLSPQSKQFVNSIYANKKNLCSIWKSRINMYCSCLRFSSLVYIELEILLHVTSSIGLPIDVEQCLWMCVAFKLTVTPNDCQLVKRRLLNMNAFVKFLKLVIVLTYNNNSYSDLFSQGLLTVENKFPRVTSEVLWSALITCKKILWDTMDTRCTLNRLWWAILCYTWAVWVRRVLQRWHVFAIWWQILTMRATFVRPDFK